MTVALNFLFGGRISPVSDSEPGPAGPAFYTSIVDETGGELVIDCTVTETHVGKVAVTVHPVEEGFSITDHARPEPARVTLDGIVTNTPFHSGVREVFTRGISFPSNTDADAAPGEPGPAGDALSYLWDLQAFPVKVTIETELRSYENMLLTDFNAPRNASVGDAIRFTATFQEIRTVEVKKTTPRIIRRAKAKKKGKVETKPVAPPKLESSLSRASRSAIGF